MYYVIGKVCFYHNGNFYYVITHTIFPLTSRNSGIFFPDPIYIFGYSYIYTFDVTKWRALIGGRTKGKQKYQDRQLTQKDDTTILEIT